MTRFIIPIILIAISITVFFTFSNPFFKDIKELNVKVDSYNQALDNSQALEKERDKLTLKENSFDPVDLAKLRRLLPESIDNIRLILEIEQIALPYGMVLKDVKYDTKSEETTEETGFIQGGAKTQTTSKDYGVWDLAFSTTGTYSNFINFTRDLENNLRIVDISSIQFSSDTGSGSSRTSSSSSSSSSPTPSSQSYKYDFKIKTYWLKN